MLQIQTKRKINAVIEAPPSKSYTNRALIIAALAKGKSIIKNPLFSDDTDYMVSALKEFGIRIDRKGKDLVVYGSNGILKTPTEKIFAGKDLKTIFNGAKRFNRSGKGVGAHKVKRSL